MPEHSALGRVRHKGWAMTKPSKGTKVQARAKPGTKKPAKATTRRRLMGMCEKVEVMLLAMEKVAGGVLAWELGAIADRLNAAVMAG